MRPDKAKLERQKTKGVPRSSQWPSVRKKHLQHNGECALCGGKRGLNVHHILPFHLDKSKELDPGNLITLCEGNRTINCHLRFGHWGSFATKHNPHIRDDAAVWAKRFAAKKMDEGL